MKEPFNLDKILFLFLNKYVKQINSNRYDDYRITDHFFGVDCPFKK